jgi:hypothetical protein
MTPAGNFATDSLKRIFMGFKVLAGLSGAIEQDAGGICALSAVCAISPCDGPFRACTG